LELAGSELNYDEPLQELNVSFPGLLQGKSFRKLTVAQIAESTERLHADPIFMFVQCGDSAAAQALTSQVTKILTPGSETLMVSLVELPDSSDLVPALKLPRGWVRNKDAGTDVSAHFYSLSL